MNSPLEGAFAVTCALFLLGCLIAMAIQWVRKSEPDEDEVVGMVTRLPEEFVARRARYNNEEHRNEVF